MAEICNECGRSVKMGSGRFVNRIPDCNTQEERKEMGKPYPEGDFVCAECDSQADMKNMDELLKSKPLSMEELKTKSPLSEDKTKEVMDFLQKYGFIKVKDDQVQITQLGLSFLELPVVARK